MHVLKAPRHHPLPLDSLLLSAQDTHLNVSGLCLLVKKVPGTETGAEGCSDMCEGNRDFPLVVEDNGSC